MSKATALTPTVSIATAYKVAEDVQPISQFNQPLEPDCSQTGVSQTATPQVSPSA